LETFGEDHGTAKEKDVEIGTPSRLAYRGKVEDDIEKRGGRGASDSVPIGEHLLRTRQEWN